MGNKLAKMIVAAPKIEDTLFCWPLTGIVVNVVKETGGEKDVIEPEYWMKRLSEYNPESVEIIWDYNTKASQPLVTFSNDLFGILNAIKFEKAFEADHLSKKEWNASQTSSCS